MYPEILQSAFAVITVLATYLLHSTCLLGLAWLFARHIRPADHRASEFLWKSAAVGGVFTTLLQPWLVNAPTSWQLCLSAQHSRSPTISEQADRPLRTVASPPTFDFQRAPVESALVLSADNDSRLTPLASNVDSTDDFSDSAMADSSSKDVSSRDTTDDSESDRHTINLTATADDRSLGTSQLSSTLPIADDMRPSASAVPSPSLTPATVSREFDGNDHVWLLGALTPTVFLLTGFLRLAGQNVRFWWHAQRFQPLNHGRLQELLDELRTTANVPHSVTLLESTSHLEPMAFGLWRWTIVVPQDLESRLSTEELRALLAHELAHLVRRDTWWQWLGRGLCTCLAFQPLNFVARRRWQQAAEFACDEWATRQGVPPLSLARCLTEVAEWKLDRRLSAVTLAAVGAPSDLGQRVERLLDDTTPQASRRKSLRTGTVSTLILGTLASMLLMAPRMEVLAIADEASQVTISDVDIRVTQRTDQDTARTSADESSSIPHQQPSAIDAFVDPNPHRPDQSIGEDARLDPNDRPATENSEPFDRQQPQRNLGQAVELQLRRLQTEIADLKGEMVVLEQDLRALGQLDQATEVFAGVQQRVAMLQQRADQLTALRKQLAVTQPLE